MTGSGCGRGLAGRTVVVTGAGRGLGLAMAHAIGAAGARVVVAERDPERGRKAVAELAGGGCAATFVETDVASEVSVNALAAAVAEMTQEPRDGSVRGRRESDGADEAEGEAAARGDESRSGHSGDGLYGLVNNAGLANAVGGRPFHEISVADWDRVMAVNARGPWLVSRALLPLLGAGGVGRIVNVSSDAALYGSPRLAHYIASKGAVIAFTRAMARELGDQGVTVNAIAPGLVETESSVDIPAERHELYALNRAISRPQRPDDVAGAVLFLLSDQARFVTGQTLVVDGGFVMP